jgi:putative oxidoreductase
MADQFDQGRFETRVEGPTERPMSEQERWERERERVAGTGAWQRQTRTVPEERIGHRALMGDLAYAALRITVGSILLAHGLLKLQDTTAWVEQVRALGVPIPATMALLSVLAEVGGGIALILGLFTRLASLGIAINMLVAVITVHAGHGLLTQNGGFEFPLTLLMASVLFVAEGSRRFGIDAKFWRAMHRRREEPHAVRPHYATR